MIWMAVVVDVMSTRWSMTRMMRMVATQGEEVHDDEDEEHEVEDDPMQGMSSYLPVSPCMSLSLRCACRSMCARISQQHLPVCY